MIVITIKLPGSPTLVADMGNIVHTALVANAIVQVQNDQTIVSGVGDITSASALDDAVKVNSREHKIVK